MFQESSKVSFRSLSQTFTKVWKYLFECVSTFQKSLEAFVFFLKFGLLYKSLFDFLRLGPRSAVRGGEPAMVYPHVAFLDGSHLQYL